MRHDHPENHLISRIGWLRAAVLGANDGIISTASLVMGVASAASSSHEALIAGVAGMAAGAMAMAAGEYVSVSSQADTEHADLAREAREARELDTDTVHEREELAQIYVARGVEAGLAAEVARQLMAKNALGAQGPGRTWYFAGHYRAARAGGAGIGRYVLGGCCGAVGASGLGAHGSAASGRRSWVADLPGTAGNGRREGGRCGRDQAHDPGDLLGCPRHGHDNRDRRCVWKDPLMYRADG